MVTGRVPMVLRPATATVEEGLAFARLLEQAQEGMFRIMLGPRAGAIVAGAFARPGHELAYEHVVFAEQGGWIVGMASGYTSEAHRRFTDEPLRAAAGWRRYRMAAFTRFNRRALRFMATLADGDFYLRSLAVEPSRRGGGIGTLLMAAVEDRARDAGARCLALDVAGKNRDARRLYERLGMTVLGESPRWFGLPDTNLIRMTKPLSRSG
jgi:ribosomal protein S18 acetylase RimI-like enzyme